MLPSEFQNNHRRPAQAVDVCIVVINQNQGLTLERCIRSCLAQTFPGRFHEVLVVDAGSTDCSREVISSYGSQITPILLEPPTDLAQAVSIGLRKAGGRYVLLVRAQDFLSDYMILFQAIWLYQNYDFGGVGVDFWMVEADSDSKVRRITQLSEPSPYGILYRKELLVKAGLFDANQKQWAPEQLAQTLTLESQIGHIPIPFYRFQQNAAASQKAAQLLKERGSGS